MHEKKTLEMRNVMSETHIPGICSKVVAHMHVDPGIEISDGRKVDSNLNIFICCCGE